MTTTGEGWIDVSVWPQNNGMVHRPDDPPFLPEWVLDMKRGNVADISKLAVGSCTGTRMNAPLRLVREGKGLLHHIPLTATIGRARVIEVHDPESVKPDELRPHGISRGERVLLKTRNSARCRRKDAFAEDFVYLSREAARYLVTCEIRSVGIDYLSVGGLRKDGVETHRALLEAGIWVIESLDLPKVEPGEYELICLPLEVELSDGAPARAILRAI